MKINRKDTPKTLTFGTISIGTTFTLEGRTAVFMKADMTAVIRDCDRCGDEIYFNEDYALNLATGEMDEFDYKMPVNPIECELNEI